MLDSFYTKPVFFQFEVGLAQRRVEVFLDGGKTVLVDVVADQQASQMVLVQPKLVKFRCHPYNVVRVSPVLRWGIQQIQISVLLVDQARNKRRMLIVLRISLLIYRPFEVVIQTIFSEIPVEYFETVDNVHNIEFVAVETKFTEGVGFFEHGGVGEFCYGGVGFLFVAAGQSV